MPMWVFAGDSFPIAPFLKELYHSKSGCHGALGLVALLFASIGECAKIVPILKGAIETRINIKADLAN